MDVMTTEKGLYVDFRNGTRSSLFAFSCPSPLSTWPWLAPEPIIYEIEPPWRWYIAMFVEHRDHRHREASYGNPYLRHAMQLVINFHIYVTFYTNRYEEVFNYDDRRFAPSHFCGGAKSG